MDFTLKHEIQEENKMKGTVKFYNHDKHFGFITGEDGKDYFVHSSGLADGVSLNDNDEVMFDVEQGDRGLKAANVQKDDGSAPAEEAPMDEAPAEEAQEPAAEEDEVQEDAA